jgi:hypothetical protein
MPWPELGYVSVNTLNSLVFWSARFALCRIAFNWRNMERVESCLISSTVSQTESCSFIMICKIKSGTQLTALARSVFDYEEAVRVQKLTELESVCNKPSE